MFERFPQAIRTATRDNMRDRVHNLFIDFNGLIHECILRSAIVDYPVSEAELQQHVASYLNEIVMQARPTRMVYLAIDGPAPDAKIRQQRLRRIQTELIKQSTQRFEQRQDWNDAKKRYREMADKFFKEDGTSAYVGTSSITPGTCFMRRLQSFLVAYIASVQEQQLWGPDLEVVLNGPTVPGEGEHKIISEIKKMQRQVDLEKEYEHYDASAFTLNMVSIMRNKPIGIKKDSKAPKFTEAPQEAEESSEQKPAKAKAMPSALKTQQSQTEGVQSNVIYGMDGDLFILSLGVNCPELYIMRRWQGIMVSDFEQPENSKYDAWNVGMVYIDIQLVREQIIYEMLQSWISDQNKFAQILQAAAPNTTIVKAFMEMYEALEDKEDAMKVVQIPPQMRSNLMECLLWSKLADKIIRDFVALTLFIGNDFLPEVPGQQIKAGALDQLISYYSDKFLRTLPFQTLVNDDLSIHMEHFGEMFQILADKCEQTQIKEDLADFMKLYGVMKDNKSAKEIDPEGQWRATVLREMDDIKEELSEDILAQMRSKMPKLSQDDEQKVKTAYKKRYYLKFQSLQLDHHVNPPTNMPRHVAQRLTLLDHYENLNELKMDVEYSQQLRGYLANDTYVQHFAGFHQVMRSYLKTLQWVILYYLSPEGVPQWNWEFPYPFTPMCSDMAIYCSLFKIAVGTLDPELASSPKTVHDGVAEDSESSHVEDNVKVKQIQLDAKELLERGLREYRYPQFRFELGQAKSTLMQLLFTIHSGLIPLLLPNFIASKVPQEFIDQQPKYEDVLILDHQSAFQSFTGALSLKRKNPGGAVPIFQCLSYGYHPAFATFYKDYPVGIADGVDFSQLDLFKSAIFTGPQKDFFNAVYSKGACIHFAPASYGNATGRVVLAGPGSSVSIKNDKLDVDYFDEFKMETYPTNPNLKTGRTCLDINFPRLGFNSLKRCFIFIEDETKVAAVTAQLMLQFTAPTQEMQGFERPWVSRYRGPHVLVENNASFTVERMKLNVAALQVYGKAMCADQRIVLDPTSVVNGIFGQSVEYDSKLLAAQLFNCKPPEKQSQRVLTQLAEYLEITEEEVLLPRIQSYYNDYYGVIVGFVQNDRIYLRDIKQNANEVPRFEDVTDKANKMVESQSKDAPTAKTAIAQILATMTEFSEFNQAIKAPSDAPLILMAPIRRSWAGALTVDPRQGLHGLRLLINTHPVPWQQYLRTDLVPFEQLPIQPVYMSSMHRRSQHLQFMRSICDVILGQREALQRDSDISFDGSVLCVNDDAMKIQIDPQAKGLNLSDAEMRCLAYALQEIDLDELNMHLRPLQIQLTLMNVIQLTRGVLIGLADYSNRQMGMQAQYNATARANVKNGRVVLNKLFALEILIYAAAFPHLFKEVIRVSSQKTTRDQKPKMFADLPSGSAFEDLKINKSIDRFPLLPQPPRTQAELAAQLSFAQYTLHQLIYPLAWQIIAEQHETHVPRVLVSTITSMLDAHVHCEKVEKPQADARQPYQQQELVLGSFVYVRPLRCMGIIISTSKENVFRAVVTSRSAQNYNSSYSAHRFVVGRRDDFVCLNTNVMFGKTLEAVQKMPLSLPDLSSLVYFNPDLAQQNQELWFSKIQPAAPAPAPVKAAKAPKPAAQAIEIMFEEDSDVKKKARPEPSKKDTPNIEIVFE